MSQIKNAVGSVKKTPVSSSVSKSTIKSHVIRNTTSLSEKDLGDSSYNCVCYAEDLLELNTVKNLRTYIGEYSSKRRNKTHKAIARTLEDNPKRFPQRSQGLTITCTKAEVNSEKNQITVFNESLINGAQTQGELRRFFDELDALEDAVDSTGRKQIEVKIEILCVTSSEDEISEIAIARNDVTPVKSISQAGARKQLDDLKDSMLKHNDNWIIETSETDKDSSNSTIDTTLLLQVIRLLTPDSVRSPDKEVTPSEILRPYKSAANCLEDFCSWQIEKDTDQIAKEKYDFVVSIAPKAWAEYQHWMSHPKWTGTGIQESYKTSKKRVCKKKNGKVISCSNGLVFPILNAIKHFVKKDSKGEWIIDKHDAFDPSRMTKTAVRLLHNDYDYDPMTMGRAIGSYSALSEYPSAMIDILGL